MFYCNHCEEPVKEKQLYFDSEENAFRHKKCGQLVEYIFKGEGI